MRTMTTHSTYVITLTSSSLSSCVIRCHLYHLLLLFYVILVVAPFACDCQFFNNFLSNSAPTVSTAYGVIQGQRVYVRGNAVDEFIGVPFAEPPVGNLRFAKPIPPKKWLDSGPYLATQLKPYCAQPDPNIIDSEDCLYLNIWRPANIRRDRKLPVFHWIHGGGFVYGSAMESIFNGSAWPAMRDVILVAQNYRLSVFGFFHGNESDAPGNLALWDHVAALTWIRDNIESFGGNASHVTLMGQSAGSASVGIHLVSPISDGLFHRAVMMSGSSFATLRPKANIDRSKKLAQKLGCTAPTSSKKKSIGPHHRQLTKQSTDWLSCIRQVPYKQILQVMKSDSYFQFNPNMGDEIYPSATLPILEENAWNSTLQTRRVELLSGLTAQEGTYLLFSYCKGIPGFERSNPQPVTKENAKECIRRSIWHRRMRDIAADYYTKDIDDNDSTTLRLAASQAAGDFMFTCPVHFYSQLYAQGEGRDLSVHSYHITYKSRYSYFCHGSNWAGVCHGDELYMLFGDPIRRPFAYNTSDITFSEQLIHDWTYFGIHGHPPRQLRTLWPSYTDPPVNQTGTFGVYRRWKVATKNTEVPIYPNYMELNPYLIGNLVYHPYPNCQNFWRNYLFVWDPTHTDNLIRNRAMAPPMSKSREM